MAKYHQPWYTRLWRQPILRLLLVLTAVYAFFSFEDKITPKPIVAVQQPTPYVFPDDPLTIEKPIFKGKSIQRVCSRKAKVVRLLFPHVNKAGGRSLEATFDMEKLFGVQSLRHITVLPRSPVFAFDLVDGHRFIDYIAKRAKCSLKSTLRHCENRYSTICLRWIFMLREPVPRMVSAFYTHTGRDVPNNTPNINVGHFNCAVGSRARSLMKDPDFTIEDFVRLSKEERDACAPFVSNLHVKYLASDVKPKNQLKVAKKRLKEMSWIGILERSEESMRLLSYTLGISLIRYSKVSNVNKYNKTLSPLALEVLGNMNTLDAELYEYAKEIFESRMQVMMHDTENAHYNEDKFVCDTNVKCWDKLAKSPAWTQGEEKDLSYLTPGEQKERILCSPVEGCSRASTDATFASKNLKRNCILSFAIIGTRKGGTTSLYNYLVQHDRIKGVRLDQDAQSGELLFFRLHSNLTHVSSSKARREYNRVFMEELGRMKKITQSNESKFDKKFHITGESSVGIGPSCFAAKVLRSACGSRLKFIYLVRNPIERMISQHKMRVRTNRTDKFLYSPDLEVTLEKDIKEFLRVQPKANNWWERRGAIPCLFKEDYFNSVWSGLYVVHLSRWLQYYNPSNLLILKSEDFFKDPAKVLNQAFAFLGVDDRDLPVDDITKKVYNAASRASGTESLIRPELREKLQGIFAPYNKALEAKFRIPTEDWV